MEIIVVNKTNLTLDMLKRVPWLVADYQVLVSEDVAFDHSRPRLGAPRLKYNCK